MTFHIASFNNDAFLDTKGNVRIDLKHYQSPQGQSICSTDKNAILRTEDSCMNVLLAIADDDNLEESDLSRIDSVASKYKKEIDSIDKNLKDGEVTIFFNNGYELTIDFYTEAEREADKIFLQETTSTVEKVAKSVYSGFKKVAHAGFNWFDKNFNTFMDRMEGLKAANP